MVETEFKETLKGHNPTDYTKESVKLVRNTKGFTWEIKICSSDVNGIFNDIDFKRLEDLNKKMEYEYGKDEKY